MNFDGFYGNTPIKTALNAHLFHAYLIEGPTGSGRHTLASLLTNALVCDGENPPCRACRQCYKISQGCHPDVIDIPSEIPVEELRELLADLPLKPNDAKHKVYRIDRAEKLHPTAQNLLLKTLEEPPAHAVFLLLCNSKEGVLPTVRSRCQILSLAPLPEDVIQGYFKTVFGVYGEKERNAVLLSAGFLGKALEIYKNEDGEQMRRCEEWETALRTRNLPAVFRICKFKTREELVDFYNAFSLHLKLRLRNASPEDVPYYAELTRRWDGARAAMQTNVNVKFWNANLARMCLGVKNENNVRQKGIHS